MKKFMMGMFILLFVVAVSCVGSAKKAEAFALRLTADDGLGNGVGTSIFSVLISDVNADGHIVFSGTLGVFSSIFTVAGTTKPLEGSASNPIMNIIGLSAQSSVAGSLLVEISDTGYTGLVPGFTTTLNGTSIAGTIDANLYYDNGDVLGIQGANVGSIAPFSDTGFTGVSTVASPLLDGSYSLTLISEVVHFAGGGSTQFDTHVNAVPEPGTIALLGIGLAGLVGVGARRRAKKKAA